MGKVVGLVGSASGKIGNLVYAVTNGIQTARIYQPNVYNPKTALQNAQRAKGNLAGRMSSFTPRTALYGLGVNNRSRRGAFLRNVLKKAIVTINGSTYSAKIADEDVIFSRGAVPALFGDRILTAGSGQLTIQLRGIGSPTFSAEDYAALQTRIVVMVYDASNNLIEVITKIATKPEQGAQAITIVPISTLNAYEAVVYAIPMSTSDGSAVSISTSLVGKSDDDIIAALTANGNSIVFNYGSSFVIGQANFTPSQAKDEVANNRNKK